jgi:DNA-binding XRE family transcriptional regulator
MPKTPPTLPEPTPKRIVKARENAQLTQAQAAEVVYLRHSMRWSEYERGVNGMPLSTWELFLFKTGQRELVLE